jgi:4-hydroxythreonine-4-phosphate dehydrogenase
MGDASGVGPEIVLKAVKNNELKYPYAIYGDRSALEYYNRLLDLGVNLDDLNIADHKLLTRIRAGELDKDSGNAAREYVISATKAALSGDIDAMVTLPMNKEATQLSDPGFVGHTELIGALCGVKDVTIMLASDQLIVTHVSTHCSLSDAIVRCKKDRVQTVIRMTNDAAHSLMPKPRIAVAGLNPHAGENGLFGHEEINEIRPAVDWARSQGMPVEGPFPPDTLFFMAVRKKRFDVVVCMYHDQGHVPLKLLDFEGGVNVALGLPIIRTSVDHGTAFDIAGQGVASTRSLICALNFAAKMAANRQACLTSKSSV